MHSRSKLILAAVTALVALSIGVASASANRLSVDDRDFRIVANPLITPDVGGSIECTVTLSGSYHSSTFTKTANSLIGVVTSARAESTCASGRLTLLSASLPWHITYQSFNGTLPRFTRTNVRIIGLSAEATSEGVTCLFRSDAAEPVAFGLDYIFPIFILIEFSTAAIDIDSGGFACDLAGDVEISGDETNVEDGGGALVAIALI